MCILCVGIDGALVLAALVEEVEFQGSLMALLVALAAHKPVVGALGLTGYGDEVTRFGFEIA